MCGRPMAYSRNGECGKAKGEVKRSYSETPGEALSSFKPQRSGHRYHTHP